MTPAIHRVCNALEWFGAALVVLVSFPLIAFGLFFLRALFLVVAGALILGVAVLWCAYPPFRGWVAAHLHGPWSTHPVV